MRARCHHHLSDVSPCSICEASTDMAEGPGFLVCGVDCRSQIYPSLSPLWSRFAPVMRLCRGLLLLQASGLFSACGICLLLGWRKAYAPGRSKRLIIIITGGTSWKAECFLKPWSLSRTLNGVQYTLLTYPVDRFSFLPSCFHSASTPLRSISH